MLRALRLLSLLAALALASTARAQDAAPTSEPEPPPPAETADPAEAPDVAPPPEPETDAPTEAEAAMEAARETLRAAHLGELAGRTRLALQAAQPLLRSSGDITRIERALPGTEREIRRLAHPTRLARIPHLSQRELADLRQDWRRHGNVLEDWQSVLSQRASALEEARAPLVELKRTWSDLRDVSIAAGRPEGRHERITSSHDQTRTATAALDEAREQLAALADRVSELQIVTEDVADQLRDAATVYRERLWVRDAPPLHEGLSAPDAEEASVATQARESLLERAETPAELLRDLLPTALALALGFVALLGASWALARAQRPRPAGEPSDGTEPRAPLGALAREVVRRPISSAALLMLLAGVVTLDHAPIVVYDVLFFATLVPLWRAVPPLSPPGVRPLVLGTIGFLAIDRLESMLPDGTSLLRLVLLVEAVVALGAIAWWLRVHGADAGSASSAPSRMQRWARLLAVLTALVLTVALVANVLGYAFLATVLTRGVGFSLYNGLALTGAVVVVEALVDLTVISPFGQRLRSLREHAPLVHARTLRLLTVVATLAWTGATLEGFGVWGSVSAWAESTLTQRHTIGTLEISLGAVLGAILLLVVTTFVVRLVRFVLELDLLPLLALEPGVDGAISGLTGYAVGGAGLLFALAFLGIDASQIALVAGALGVGIGFGLQGIVANFIAGIVLMLERPVRLGDFIEVGSLVGSVDRIGLRSSTVRGLDGAEVIVPNESLISREVINWTLSDRKRRVEVKVGVAYGSDPHRVLEVLRGVLAAHVEVIELDRARFVFEGFGDSSLNFCVKFWAGSFEDSIRLKSEVGVAVHDALDAAGIVIPFPQREVRVISMPDAPPAPAK